MLQSNARAGEKKDFNTLGDLIQALGGCVCGRIGIIRLFCLLSASLFIFHSQPASAVTSVGYAEYFILGDEADILAALTEVNPVHNTAGPIRSRLSFVAAADGVQVYLDEHENGYNFDPADPYNTADAKWDAAAGGPGEQGPALNEGEVLTLTESDTFVTGSNGVDGGDRLYITQAPSSLVRTVWPTTPGPYLAGSWEMYPTVAWQSEYTVPVGENIDFSPESSYPFEYTYLYIQAEQDDTRVVITDPTLGVRLDTVINKGDNIYLDDITAGTTAVGTDSITGDPLPIQAGLITSLGQEYDARFYNLTPQAFLGNTYLIPTPSMQFSSYEYSGRTIENAAYVYAFSDGTQVTIETASGFEWVNLDKGEVHRYVMPTMPRGEISGPYGAQISSQDDAHKIWVLVACDDDAPTLDWGYQTLNPDYLWDDYYVPFAPSNPLHVTPVSDNTHFYVDWDNDGSVDETFTLHRFYTRMLFPPAPDYKADGAHISADGKFSVAWGQDNTEDTPGERDYFPGGNDLDFGYTTIPFRWFDPILSIEKSVDPAALGPGGGTVEFTVVLTSEGWDFTPPDQIYHVDLFDVLPDGWEYVSGTTSIDLGWDGNPPYTGSTYDPIITGGGSDLQWDLNGMGLDDTMPQNETITLVFQARTVAGQYPCGYNTDTAEAYGTSMPTEGHINEAVFRPKDTAAVLISCLEIEKTSDTAGDPVASGDTITYTITLTNPSDSGVTHTGITIVDPEPVYTTYVDRSTSATGPGTFSGGGTFRDEFGAVAYDNSDGSEDWSGDPWDETDSGGGGASAGYIRVVSVSYWDRELQFTHLYSHEHIDRRADLTGATTATLSFDWRTSSLDSGERIGAWISIDGSNFTRLAWFDSDPSSGSASYDISSYLSANTTIRFGSPDQSWSSDNDQAYFDNVEIAFTRSGTATVTKDNNPWSGNPQLTDGVPPALLESDDGFTLAPGDSMTVTFQVTVDDPLPTDLTEIPNTACVTTDQVTDSLCDSAIDYPTAAMIGAFAAYEENGRVVVQWETAAELGTVGFHLFRKDAAFREYFRMNDRLLNALLVYPQGGTYRYVDPSAKPGNTYQYVLAEVEASGRNRLYGPYTVTVSEAADASASFLRAMGSGIYDRTPHALPGERAARLNARAAEVESFRKAPTGAVASAAAACKIGIREDGLYRVDASVIADVMGRSQQRVERWISRARLKLSTGGEPVAWLPAADSSAIYFFGRAMDSRYTDTRIYWLEKGAASGSGQIMDVTEGAGPDPVADPESLGFMETVHFEEDAFAMTALFDDPDADFWLWNFVVDTGTADSTLPLAGATRTGEASLTVNLKGGDDDTGENPDHCVVVSIGDPGEETVILNGETDPDGDGRWDGLSAYAVDIPFDAALLKDGDNRVRLGGVLLDGVGSSVCYLDSFDLRYKRRYEAVDNRLFFRGDENAVVTITGFTNNDICVLDLGDPDRPKVVSAVTIDGVEGNYRVTLAPSHPDTLYLALTADEIPAVSPPDIRAEKSSSLREKANEANWLAVGPAELLDAIRDLADYREGQGLKTMVVDLEDIYDEFNFGMTSPYAIRDFLSYAHDNWNTHPRYVVLAGDGSYNYKHDENVVPILMTYTGDGLFACDNCLAGVSGDDGVPETAVGRLPVLTSTELYNYITKLKAYEGASGEWANRVLAVADNPDDGGDFPIDKEQAAVLASSAGYSLSRLYMENEAMLTVVRSQLLEDINAGASYLNYMGHADMRTLAEGLLSYTDLDALANGERLFAASLMTCLAGRFEITEFDCIAEGLVLKQDGGAVAAWAPTGLSRNDESKILDMGLYAAIFQEKESRLGDAVLKALAAYASSGKPPYILRIYTLFGDPAAKLK